MAAFHLAAEQDSERRLRSEIFLSIHAGPPGFQERDIGCALALWHISSMAAVPKLQSGIEAKLFATQGSWETWLRRNHRSSVGIWLLLAKKGASRKSVSYLEALECALCFGWIDGQKKALDDDHWLQRFTPRRSRSIWSKINRARASTLIAQGRMEAAGLAEIERARADGRWDEAYEPSSSSKVPPDLQAALDGNARAKTFFAALDAANRYAVLWRLQTAKRAETRARRIAKFVEMLASSEKLHP